jgi:hypothetical protein
MSNLPIPQTKTEISKGPHPALWMLVGVVMGVSGTVLFGAVRSASETAVVARAKPAPVKFRGPAPRVGAQTLNPKGVEFQEEEKPSEPAKPVDPVGDVLLVPTLPGIQGGDAFGDFELPRNLPAPPPIRPQEEVPPASSVRVTPPKRAEDGLDALVAEGLPKPPAARKLRESKGLSDERTVELAAELVAEFEKLGGRSRVDTDADRVTLIEVTVPIDSADAVAALAKERGLGSVQRTDLSVKRNAVREAKAKVDSLVKLREALLESLPENSDPVRQADTDLAAAKAHLVEVDSTPDQPTTAILRISMPTR